MNPEQGSWHSQTPVLYWTNLGMFSVPGIPVDMCSRQTPIAYTFTLTEVHIPLVCDICWPPCIGVRDHWSPPELSHVLHSPDLSAPFPWTLRREPIALRLLANGPDLSNGELRASLALQPAIDQVLPQIQGASLYAISDETID